MWAELKMTFNIIAAIPYSILNFQFSVFAYNFRFLFFLHLSPLAPPFHSQLRCTTLGLCAEAASGRGAGATGRHTQKFVPRSRKTVQFRGLAKGRRGTKARSGFYWFSEGRHHVFPPCECFYFSSHPKQFCKNYRVFFFGRQIHSTSFRKSCSTS